MHLITWPQITSDFLASQGFSDTFLDRYWRNIDKNGPIPDGTPHLGNCWIWKAFIGKNGYGQLQKGRRGAGLINSHVAAWVIHYGLVPKGMFVCHYCDVKPCCNPNHLWVASNGDNARDMWIKGRAVSLRGEDVWCAKLSWRQIREIRSIYARGEMTIAQLARAYSKNRGNMSRIVHNQIWKESPPLLE